MFFIQREWSQSSLLCFYTLVYSSVVMSAVSYMTAQQQNWWWLWVKREVLAVSAATERTKTAQLTLLCQASGLPLHFFLWKVMVTQSASRPPPLSCVTVCNIHDAFDCPIKWWRPVQCAAFGQHLGVHTVEAQMIFLKYFWWFMQKALDDIAFISN